MQCLSGSSSWMFDVQTAFKIARFYTRESDWHAFVYGSMQGMPTPEIRKQGPTPHRSVGLGQWTFVRVVAGRVDEQMRYFLTTCRPTSRRFWIFPVSSTSATYNCDCITRCASPLWVSGDTVCDRYSIAQGLCDGCQPANCTSSFRNQ